MKINLIKTLFLFFIVFLMESKLTAQTQNNSSVQLVDVNLLNSPTTKNEVNVSTSVSKIVNPVGNNIPSADSSMIYILEPKVFDPKSMDSKPE